MVETDPEWEGYRFVFEKVKSLSQQEGNRSPTRGNSLKGG
jgi:hypothetical protein